MVLLTIGDQTPDIPLFEVDGNVKVSPEQIGDIESNVGVIIGLTVIVKVVLVAHSPASGVKV